MLWIFIITGFSQKYSLNGWTAQKQKQMLLFMGRKLESIWYIFIIKAAYERLSLRAFNVEGSSKFRTFFVRKIAVTFALTRLAYIMLILRLLACSSCFR